MYRCPLETCTERFGSRRLLNEHMERAHPEDDDDELPQATQGPQLPNYNVVNNRKFRPYQQRLYQQLSDIRQQNPQGCSILNEACTGSGKGCMVTVFPGAFRCRRMLFVVPTAQTKDEAVKKFMGKEGHERFLDRVNAVPDNQKHLVPSTIVLESGKDVPANTQQALEKLRGFGVVIATAQLISRNSKKPSATLNHMVAASELHMRLHGGPLFDLIVFDEGHHAPSPTWTLIQSHLGGIVWEENGVERKPFIVYMSGTPYPIIKAALFDEETERYTLRAAIQEHMAKDVVLLNITNPAASVEEAVRQVAHVVAHLLKNKRAQSHNSIAHKALAMVNGKATADQFASIVNAAQIPLHQLPGGGVRYLTAESIHGSHSEQVRLSKLQRFEGRQVFEEGCIDLLFQDKLIGEGYDHPCISVAVSCCKCKTLGRAAQFWGRSIRKLLQDFVGQGLVVHPGDNVAHIVTHSVFDQVQLFAKYVQQQPGEEAAEEAEAEDDEDDDDDADAMPAPASPADQATNINRYFFPMADRERVNTLRQAEDELHFKNARNWEVNTIELAV